MKTHWHHQFAILAAAGILLAGAVDSHALFGFGKKTPLPTPTAAMASVSGSVQVQAAGQAGWTDAVVGQALNAGDKIRTGADGKAVVAFSDGSKIQLSENSNFALNALEPARFSMSLDVGTIEAWVAKLRGRRFETRMPTAVAAVRGTHFLGTVTPEHECTMSLFDGRLSLTNNSGVTISLSPNRQVTVESKGTFTAPKIIPPDVKPAPEPKVQVPAPKPAQQQPAPQQQPAQQQPAQQQPAPQEQTTTTQPPPPPPPPPPSPQQNTTVVSPSSP